jgi:ABC-type sugar transport system permease subunit
MPEFWQVLVHTVYYTVDRPLAVTLPLFMALLVNQNCASPLRTTYFHRW